MSPYNFSNHHHYSTHKITRELFLKLKEMTHNHRISIEGEVVLIADATYCTVCAYDKQGRDISTLLVRTGSWIHKNIDSSLTNRWMRVV